MMSHWFIRKYLVSLYYVSGTSLDARDASLDIAKTLTSYGFYSGRKDWQKESMEHDAVL